MSFVCNVINNESNVSQNVIIQKYYFLVILCKLIFKVKTVLLNKHRSLVKNGKHDAYKWSLFTTRLVLWPLMKTLREKNSILKANFFRHFRAKIKFILIWNISFSVFIGHLTKKSVGDDKMDKNAWSQKPLLWAMKEVRVNTVYANYYAIWTFFRRLFQTEYIVGIKSICRASILFT